jgi:hypothetical protein
MNLRTRPALASVAVNLALFPALLLGFTLGADEARAAPAAAERTIVVRVNDAALSAYDRRQTGGPAPAVPVDRRE